MSESIGSMLGILANTQEAFTPRQRGHAAADLAIKIADMQDYIADLTKKIEEFRASECAWQIESDEWEEKNKALQDLLGELFSDPNTHQLNDDMRDRISAELGQAGGDLSGYRTIPEQPVSDKSSHVKSLLSLADQLKERSYEGYSFEVTDAANRMYTLEDTIAQLQAQVSKLRGFLVRYRNEVPTGHHPHMICLEIDEYLAEQESGE